MLVVARAYNPYKMRAMGHCNKMLENHFIRYMENKSPMTMQEFLYGCPPDSLSDSNLAGWVTPSKNILKAMHTLALPKPQIAEDGNDHDDDDDDDDDNATKNGVYRGSVIVISSEQKRKWNNVII